MKSEIGLKAENKLSLILSTANKLFAKKGFERTSISQIAKAANISNGSIYNYFKNKEDLLFSIPEKRMETFLPGARSHLKGLKGAPNKLRKIIWYHLDFYEQNKDYTRLLLIDLRQNPRFCKSKAYEMIRQYSRLILQIIEEGKSEKTIRKEVDSYMVRDLILGGIEHLAIRGFIMDRFSNMSEAAEDFYNLIFSGVAEKGRMVTLSAEEFEELKKLKE